jgi:hypothetical protein
MPHNSRIRPPGTWVSLTTVSPSEFEAFDAYTFSAINGDTGGTWAPADEIVIGGLGMSVTGPFAATDVQGLTMTDGGFVSFNDEAIDSLAIRLGEHRSMTLGADAFVELANDARIDSLAGSVIAVRGAIDVQTGGFLNIASDGLFLCQANLATSGPLVRAGALARHRHSSRTLEVADTDTTAGVENDLVIMTVAGGVGIVLTLKVTTAPTPTTGERIVVRKEGIGGGGLVVRSEGLAGTVVQWVGANIGSCELIFTGGRWRAVSAPVNGVLGPGA